MSAHDPRTRRALPQTRWLRIGRRRLPRNGFRLQGDTRIPQARQNLAAVPARSFHKCHRRHVAIAILAAGRRQLVAARAGQRLGRAPGSTRDQWITYRDQQVHDNVVLKAPYFPLNSLMLHGIQYARLGQPTVLSYDPITFKRDVRSYFATGVNLQELYISPDLLSDPDWDALVEAATWARERRALFVELPLGGRGASQRLCLWLRVMGDDHRDAQPAQRRPDRSIALLRGRRRLGSARRKPWQLPNVSFERALARCTSAHHRTAFRSTVMHRIGRL